MDDKKKPHPHWMEQWMELLHQLGVWLDDAYRLNHAHAQLIAIAGVISALTILVLRCSELFDASVGLALRFIWLGGLFIQIVHSYVG